MSSANPALQPLATDFKTASLQKINQLYFDAALVGVDPTLAPKSNDLEQASLQKINQILWNGIKTPFVRVRVANDSLNAAVPNRGVLQFDTIDSDTNGFAATSLPIDRITVPTGLGGLYVLTSESSTTGNQSTTMGMSVSVNNQLRLSNANQYISGPGSVSYGLTDTLTQIGYLNDGDYIQLVNTSVSPSPDPFTNVFLALVRLGF